MARTLHKLSKKQQALRRRRRNPIAAQSLIQPTLESAIISSWSAARSTNPKTDIPLADDFNSYSAGAPPASIWAKGFNDSVALVADGAGLFGCSATAGYQGSYYVPAGDVQDFEVEWEFGSDPIVANTNAQIIFEFRCYELGSVNPPDAGQQCYAVVLEQRFGIGPGGADAWTVALDVNFSIGGNARLIQETLLPADTHTGGPGPGDKIQVRAVGPHIEVFYQSTVAAGGTGNWIRVLEAWDTSLTSGYLGFEINGQGAALQIDNFRVRNLATRTSSPFSGSVDDDFTSYSTGPLPSGAWPVAFGDANPLQADGTNDSAGPTGSGSCASYYNTGGTVTNGEQYITLQTPIGHASGFADYLAMYWRAVAHTGGVPTSNPDCYGMFLQGDGASSWTIQVGKLVNGSLTNFLAPTKITLRAGDQFGVRYGGHQHEVWANQKDSLGTYQGWRLLFAFTDSTFTSAGYDVIEMRDFSSVNPRFTNFSMGTITFTQQTGELLLNPNADADVADWNANSSTVTRDTGTVNNGAGSIKVVTNNSTSNEGTYTATANGSITPGTRYKKRVWVNAPAGAVMKCGVEWHDSSDTLLSLKQDYFIGVGGWQYTDVDVIAPTSADHAVLYIYTGDVQQAITFYVDDASLKLSGDPMDIYTPGTTGTVNTDSATTPSVTAVTSVDVAAYVEASTCASKLSITTSDVAADVEASTCATKLTVTSTDVAAFVESATVAGVTSITSAEVAAYVESQTIKNVTSPTSAEISAYVDAATVKGITAVSSIELHEIPDSGTVSSTTTITTNDTAAYVDSNTCRGTTSITSTELYAGVDSSTIKSVTTVSSSDVAAYVESATLTSITTISSVDAIAKVYVDSATISSVTSIMSTEIAAYVEASTIAGVSSITSTDVEASIEANTVSGATSVTTSDVSSYNDVNTATGKTSVSSLETHEIPDSGNPSGTTTITTQDTAQYVENGTPATIGSASGVDLYAGIDSATISSNTTTASVELYAATDTATLSSVTTLTSNDVAAYIDGISVTTITTLSSSDIYTPVGSGDSATIASKTSISTTDIEASVDSSTIASVTTPSPTDLVTFIDASTVVTKTTVTSVDTKDNSDAATISSKTSVSTLDIQADVESGTIPSNTTTTSTDIAAFVDSSSIKSLTTLTSFEGQGFTYLDSATITDITSITYTETVDYVETPTVASTKTSTISTEVANYVDAQSPRVTTNISTSEIFTTNAQDAAVIESITYIISQEVPPLLNVEFRIVTVTKRWHVSQTSDHYACAGIKKWRILDTTEHFDTKGLGGKWILST